jgi:AcrR family transcriptional regulator
MQPAVRQVRKVQRLPRGQRRSEIMDIAQALFCEKPYSEALLSEIADRSGVVEGAIYKHFEGKRDLLVHVVERWYQNKLADYDMQLRGVKGTWNRLRFMIWKHLKVIHDEPAMVRLITNEVRSGADYRDTDVYALTRAYTQRTIAIIEEGVANGELRGGVSLRIVRDMIYGGVEHHAWSFLRGDGDFTPEDTADGITDLIYRALAVDQSNADGSIAKSVARLNAIASRLEASLDDATHRKNSQKKATR